MSGYAFFTLEDLQYVPTRYARSAWADTLVNGPAVVAAAARALEAGHGLDGFQPARLTVDLFSSVRFEPMTVRTEDVRTGNRIRVTDAHVEQGGKAVARATLVQLRRAEQPPGEVWRSGRTVAPPPDDLDPTNRAGARPYFGSDGATPPWSHAMGPHQGAGRKRFWHHPLDVVDGEVATPFQRAVTLAESTSLMSHWGTEGIGFINADLTVSLARLPHTGDIGIEADEHLSADGVAVGTASLFDRDGVFGTGSVVAVSNAGRQIDFSGRGLVDGSRDSGSGSGSDPESEKGTRV